MIAKASSTSNLRLFDYLMGENKDYKILAANYLVETTAQGVFEEISGFSKQLKNPYLHVILSLDKADSDRDFQQLVAEFTKRLGVDKNQFIAVAHYERESDTRGIHCHLVINRVSLEYKTLSDKMIGIRVREIAKQLNADFGLRNEYAADQRRAQSYRRTKFSSLERDLALVKLRADCLQILKQSNTVADYFSRLNQAGITVEKVLGKRNAQVIGHRYTIGKYSYKASEIDRSLSFRNLLRGITFANAKGDNISPILKLARDNRRQTDRLAPIFHDIKQLSRSYMPPTVASRDRDDDEEDRKEKRLSEQQNSL